MRRFASCCFIQAGEIQYFPVRIAPLEQMITKPFFRIRKGGRNSDAFTKKRETADWRSLCSADGDAISATWNATFLRRSWPTPPQDIFYAQRRQCESKSVFRDRKQINVAVVPHEGHRPSAPDCSGVASLPRLRVAWAVCNDACRSTGAGRPILVSRLACRAVCGQV